MPAAWYEDDRMVITITDVLRLQAEQIEKSTNPRRGEGRRRRGR